MKAGAKRGNKRKKVLQFKGKRECTLSENHTTRPNAHFMVRSTVNTICANTIFQRQMTHQRIRYVQSCEDDWTYLQLTYLTSQGDSVARSYSQFVEDRHSKKIIKWSKLKKSADTRSTAHQQVLPLQVRQRSWNSCAAQVNSQYKRPKEGEPECHNSIPD
jgi:hypothetical protein